ncbi:hypothetical protein BOS5A_10308 [Bosea sp. EC-HK365B]|nr:hypothetical protein BOS5A_10308 [Bosea sp. EC-HK365B]
MNFTAVCACAGDIAPRASAAAPANATRRLSAHAKPLPAGCEPDCPHFTSRTIKADPCLCCTTTLTGTYWESIERPGLSAAF